MQNSDPFLQLVQAVLSHKGIKRKWLARRLRLSRPTLSMYLHGDLQMPDAIRARIIKELEMEETRLADALATLGVETELNNETPNP